MDETTMSIEKLSGRIDVLIEVLKTQHDTLVKQNDFQRSLITKLIYTLGALLLGTFISLVYAYGGNAAV